MRQDASEDRPPGAPGDARHGLELRHLRYLVAVADAGTFTRAAQRAPRMMTALSRGFRKLGIPASQIRWEQFNVR